MCFENWCVDLLGSEFFIYTDHKTLEKFSTQKDLSQRQAQWMEFMSQYDSKIRYIKGEDNSVADVLSHFNYVKSAVEAKQTAWHPYTSSSDDDTDSTVASVWSMMTLGPLDLAKALANQKVQLQSVSAMLNVTTDKDLLDTIKAGMSMMPAAVKSFPGLELQEGLWYISN